ncbi:hypothetical protein KFE25_000518 [Diacronema lutheri]|uniref:Carbamoyl-phosphate synthase (glutamine-hydrolyzing) n=2 Tax=Diacronema lutheri TaxID=2081491 RepID=A0A8J5XRF9_DIALT|nr:hypothetical protein KFE25_000518 [Diacronema lutheri]
MPRENGSAQQPPSLAHEPSQQKRKSPVFCTEEILRIKRASRVGSFTGDAVDFLQSGVKGELVLDDGTVMSGYSFGAATSVSGEVVFNTGMVGYPEALSDPSYRGQILVLTYPIIGNYGVPPMEQVDENGLPLFFESNSVHITALIVCDYSAEPCHWNLTMTLSAWLKKHNVPALFGLDTRALTKRIRDRGAMLGKLVFAPDTADSVVQVDPNRTNLVAQVSIKQPKLYKPPAGVAPRTLGGKPVRVVAVDCGMKYNIIRYFMLKGVELLVVPWDHDFVAEPHDGLFVSNGPGDPTQVQRTVERLRLALERDKPIFGICLGNQLLALAAGATTYKMKYGNRGMNQPVIDTRTSRCYITAQNHGYAVDATSLPPGWQPFFVNGNDQSNEGIIHSTKPFFSVQFHPEASGGPTDTDFLFDMFLEKLNLGTPPVTTSYSPPKPYVRKVLLLGSGGLSIGQAGEFDYSGSQAIKALKEMGVYTVLINPNIATVQTSAGMADKVYFYPITLEYVEAVLEKERPESILLQFGGQTALNCGIALDRGGLLQKYNVQVLGTPVHAIVATEDREIFNAKLAQIGESTAPSAAAESVAEALAAARKIGYPVILRAGFALGGLGSGFANSDEECRALAEKAFANSPQVLVERSLRGWKEIEYEVVRDCKDNCITVCNMENFDPLGIHTGDSIVVAPSQTLSNSEYYKLRSVAIKVARHLGIVGECNIQYALDPLSEAYYIIEVNARLSRSSALASKATGYPLAYVAAKLALGTPLTEIRNSVTKQTMACFEPSLDYVVVKIPRWDLQKFALVGKVLGSSMKSIGEVMAIGRTFPEAMQKAIRMASPAVDGFETNAQVQAYTDAELETHLTEASDERVHVIAEAFERDFDVQHVHSLTRINHWFLLKLQSITHLRRTLAKFTIDQLPLPTLLYAKQNGFADMQVAKACRCDEDQVRELRQRHKITPWVKQVDTLAAEFPAMTNYLYMTYNGAEHDVVFDEHGVMVLGCGAYRIGSSVEFDWCAVGCVRTLRKLGYHSIMVNYNPETVSTDYDECDRLYFEEISRERVLDIYELEASAGVILSVGGQIPNNLALPLDKAGVKILGTSARNIDNAEDRFKFSKILDSIHVDQPQWQELQSVEDAKAFCRLVSYPCLIRPSYVLSGAAMKVVFNDADLEVFLKAACDVSPAHPVVISKFIENAKEIEVDAVAMNGKVVNYAIAEHVENAGVHSGDATLVLPAQKLYCETVRRVKRVTFKIAERLQICGPFNIQFLSKDNRIKVIECNLRASRTFPFVSKTLKADFIELATRVMVGEVVKPAPIHLLEIDYVGIKAPMFSFTRLIGADPILGVEMASTGEVATFGDTRHEAILTSMRAAGFKVPQKAVFLCIGPLMAKLAFLESAKLLLDKGLVVYASKGTHEFLQTRGVQTILLHKPSSSDQPNFTTYINDGAIDLVINIRDSNADSGSISDGYAIRRSTVDHSIGLLTDLKLANLVIAAFARECKDDGGKVKVKAWDELPAN